MIQAQHNEQHSSELDGLVQEHLGAMGSISKQAQSIVDSAASLATPLLQGVMAKYRCVYWHIQKSVGVAGFATAL